MTWALIAAVVIGAFVIWPDYAGLLVALVAAAIVIWAWRRYFASPHPGPIHALCAERGWSYHEYYPDLADRWDWEPFGTGHRRSATGVVIGRFDDFNFADFQYGWQTARGESKSLHVTVLFLPKALPRLQISPETSATRGLPDIDVESERLNRTFRIESTDQHYAGDVLNGSNMHTLLSLPPMTWRIDGADLVLIGGERGSATQLLRHLEALTAVAHNIPSFIWRHHGR